MTRGRKQPDVEATRELVEGDLSLLGNARVYLRLVGLRLRVVAQGNQGELINPAIDDLRQVDQLIDQVQAHIRERGP